MAQKNRIMKLKQKETLSEKQNQHDSISCDKYYDEENVKEKIQNAQRRLKESSVETHDCGENCKGYGDCQINESLIIRKDVLDKIFKEEFGDKLTL